MESGGLYVRPEAAAFNYIYRAAMQIVWDSGQRYLTSPAPKQASYPNWKSWTHSDWLRQIITAAKDEYGVALVLTSDTAWVNVAPELKAKLIATMARA